MHVIVVVMVVVVHMMQVVMTVAGSDSFSCSDVSYFVFFHGCYTVQICRWWWW